MPIYEYRCGQGHTFEVMQRMSDEPVAVCQTCEAPVQRVFHPVAVHFKGKGFYNTDYGTRKRQQELKDAGEGKQKAASPDKAAGSSDSAGKPKEPSSGGSEKSSAKAEKAA
jgi:putative FmdB family regulatory protein